MDQSQYAEAIREFAVYPEVGTGSPLARAYAALGLVGESGELRHAISNRGDRDILDEAGDVCWYATRLADEYGMVAAMVDAGVGTDQGFPTTIACRVAELVKKDIRDGLNEERAGHIQLLLGLLLTHVDLLARGRGSGIEQVRVRNVDKLTSRKSRGVIHGEGDHR